MQELALTGLGKRLAENPGIELEEGKITSML